MEYEMIHLEEKIVAGICCQTGDSDPEMGMKIGGLWQDFYGKGIYKSLENKVNEYAIGLYSNYTDEGYTVTVGAEVSENNNGGLTDKIIPAGKYARFSIKGNMVTVVKEAWENIWKMDLDRSFTADFEEYLNADMDNAEINIYIALNGNDSCDEKM